MINPPHITSTFEILDRPVNKVSLAATSYGRSMSEYHDSTKDFGVVAGEQDGQIIIVGYGPVCTCHH